MSLLARCSLAAFVSLIVLAGLWLVVVNDTPVSLNLLWVRTPPLGSGFVVLLSTLSGFAAGWLYARLSRTA